MLQLIGNATPDCVKSPKVSDHPITGWKRVVTNKITGTDGSVKQTVQAYNNLGWVTNVTLPNDEFNAAGQRSKATLPDQSRWNYLYDGLGQLVSGKKQWSDSSPVAGMQFEYGFDMIGNRTAYRAGGNAAGQDLRTSMYGTNEKNQITTRTTPGYASLMGEATNTATVSVNDERAARHGDYYYKELSANCYEINWDHKLPNWHRTVFEALASTLRLI